MSDLLNDEAVCKTEPSTLVLLNTWFRLYELCREWIV